MKADVVECQEDVSLPIWDGSHKRMPVKKGERLYVTYHEFDGSFGLTPMGSLYELLCGPEEAKHFKWLKEETPKALECPR